MAVNNNNNNNNNNNRPGHKMTHPEAGHVGGEAKHKCRGRECEEMGHKKASRKEEEE